MVDATVTLYKDIGLDSNFNRTMLFDSKQQQTNWFNSISPSYKMVLTNVNYNKLQNSFAIHEEIGDVYSYTYVKIDDLDSSGRSYYGFIDSIILVDEETTRFDIVLDSIQTFMCEWELGSCSVYREHVDRWKSDGPSRITPSKESVVGYSHIEQDIDLVYEGSLKYCTAIMAFTADYSMANTDGSEAETRTLIKYAVFPVCLDDSEIETVFNIHIGTGSEVIQQRQHGFPLDRFLNGHLIEYLGIEPTAIVGMWMMPSFAMPFNTIQVNGKYAGAYDFSLTQETVEVYLTEDTPLPRYDKSHEINMYYFNNSENSTTVRAQLLTETQIVELLEKTQQANMVSVVPAKPTKPSSATTQYSDVYEPALFMSPYYTRYITDYLGTPLLKIPDVCIDYAGYTDIYFNTVIKSTGVANTVRVGTNPEAIGVIGSSTMIPANMCDILSDTWKEYCLNQRDSDRRMMWTNIISNTVQSAVFMGYGGALVGSRSNSGRNDPKKNKKAQDVPNYANAMRTAVGFGVGASLVGSAIQGWQMWEQQQAKEQTIRNEPATTLSQSDGAGAGTKPYKFVELKVDDVSYNTARDNFRYYGYLVSAVEVPNIKSRYYFNYICTTNTTIKGSLPADIKQDLVDIFEKGITFFHADHCDTTEYPVYENIERSLLT